MERASSGGHQSAPCHRARFFSWAATRQGFSPLGPREGQRPPRRESSPGQAGGPPVSCRMLLLLLLLLLLLPLPPLPLLRRRARLQP